jgi:exodeoxyribonuclease VII large subunit
MKEKGKFTLLELNKMIGVSLGTSFPGRYWLVAEINDLRENFNGHCYLELVEKEPGTDRIVARSKATIWAFTWRMLKPYFETSTATTLSKGMMVMVEVMIEFHELYGLSFNIKDIDPVYTMGDLERKRAETIRKLEEEGILNMNKALTLPVLPSRIAVVSSPAAAGYEDFIHQIANDPGKYRIRLTLFPALMQGNSAGKSVTDAMERIYELEDQFDLVVILRGGGSSADLNCFNSYEIASHIAQFPIPVITGIGHERDHTIAGMVAHTDLKTPTAVAEFLIGIFYELDIRLSYLSGRLTVRVSELLNDKKQIIVSSIRELPRLVKNRLRQTAANLSSTSGALSKTATGFIRHNQQNLQSNHTRFEYFTGNYMQLAKKFIMEIQNKILPDFTKNLIRKKSDKLILYSTTVDLVDPENLLKKGYALILKDEKIIKSIKDLNYGDTIVTKLYDGRINSKIHKIVKIQRHL